MTIIPAHSLSASDLQALGANLTAKVRRDRLHYRQGGEHSAFAADLRPEQGHATLSVQPDESEFDLLSA